MNNGVVLDFRAEFSEDCSPVTLAALTADKHTPEICGKIWPNIWCAVTAFFRYYFSLFFSPPSPSSNVQEGWQKTRGWRMSGIGFLLHFGMILLSFRLSELGDTLFREGRGIGQEGLCTESV